MLGRAGCLRAAHPAVARDHGQTGPGQNRRVAVTSRLRQEILRDHHHCAGRHTGVCPGGVSGRPGHALESARQQASGAPGGAPPLHVRPGLPSAHQVCRAACRRERRCRCQTPRPTALARLPRLVARGCPAAVPYPKVR